jgi:phosphoribosylamine--glycine ligase
MGMTRILIVGAGGREHVLAWAFARSSRVDQVYVAPGNAGTVWEGSDTFAPSTNVSIAADDFESLIAFARDEAVGMTVVGPEAPLVSGIVDAFQDAGLLIFGPTREAAQLEASKQFSKQFLQEHAIPTAACETFTNYNAARSYLDTHCTRGDTCSVVVKADGLAAGKGVIVCDTREQAEDALKRIMVDREFGAAGDIVLIEERLRGKEVSVLAFSDGQTIMRMPPSRDHKPVFEGDQGPNTGGMGAYTHPPDVDEKLLSQIEKTILLPTIHGMAARGVPYVGVLYAGVMLTEDGPKVLEFNCRFGDPEVQAVLPLLDSDLLDVVRACVAGKLAETPVQWRMGVGATIVLSSPGYPGSYPKGLMISGVDDFPPQDDVMIFHAGTERCEDGRLVTAGGRVLAVSAVGASLTEALDRAYHGVSQISFEGMHYRRDIGGKR